MRIQQLELLVAIERSGSLRAASEILCVSQPALTKMLRSLELEFGARLAVRGPRGIKLSPEGMLLAARAGSILRELQRARDEVAWHVAKPSIQVSVGVSPAAAVLLLEGAWARLSARWPQVQLKVVDAHFPLALGQVRAGEIDMAILPLPAEFVGSDLVVRALFVNQLALVAHRSHPLSKARRLASLVETPWALTGPPGGFGDPAWLPFKELGLAVPHISVECQSFSTLLTLLPRSGLIGVLPRRFLEMHAPHYELVELPLEDPLPSVTVHSIVRADTVLTPPAQLLLEALEQEASHIRSRA